MYKKAWCTCKIVVLLIKPIAFVAFPLPSPPSDLKVPNVSYSHPTYHVNAIKLIWEIVWTGGLPHLSRLPHLFGVPHLHVNRPLLDKRLWCSGHKKYLLCKWRILICLCATISCVGIWQNLLTLTGPAHSLTEDTKHETMYSENCIVWLPPALNN